MCCLQWWEQSGTISCPTCRSEGNFSMCPLVSRLCADLPKTCECGVVVAAKLMETHKTDECGLTRIKCEWCPLLIPRREMPDHKFCCLNNPLLNRRTKKSLKRNREESNVNIRIYVNVDEESE